MQITKTLSRQETEDWVKFTSSKEPYKMVGHSFTPLKGVGKNHCSRCGLVALNNNFTRWCIDKGCNHKDHSGYDNARRRFTEL